MKSIKYSIVGRHIYNNIHFNISYDIRILVNNTIPQIIKKLWYDFNYKTYQFDICALINSKGHFIEDILKDNKSILQLCMENSVYKIYNCTNKNMRNSDIFRINLNKR